MARVKLLIVDQSALVRQTLTQLLEEDATIEVVGAVPDPLFAIDRLRRVAWPDVILLNADLPRMDGIAFLRKIMDERPTPVVFSTAQTERGAAVSVRALSSGAVDVVTWPNTGLKAFLHDAAPELAQSLRAAAQAKPKRIEIPTTASSLTRMTQPRMPTASGAAAAERIVAIGTSAGGTLALESVLTALTRACPGIVIVQHMPEHFTAAFADRLNMLCEIEVREATNGDHVLPGRALIAPGNRHMQLKRSGLQYVVEVLDGPLVNRHRPSVDVLFHSVAQVAGRHAMGIIMTGMGDDGAHGLLEMHAEGSLTIAQDEESCLVYGMPKEAVKLGAADEILPLSRIPASINAFAAQRA